MRRFKKILMSLILVLTAIVSAVSCSTDLDFGFKDLCFYHPHTAPVKIRVDWTKFRHIEKPTGMTVYAFPLNPEEDLFRFVSHNLDAVTLDLKEGHFHAFVFNQSDSEYATLEFYNLEDFDNAEVRVIQVKSNWYSTRTPETKLGAEPEWLAIDRKMNIHVTKEMVEIAEQEYLAARQEALRARQEARRELDTKATTKVTKTQHEVGTLEPKSIIKNVDIYVHLENMGYLRSALGAIENMAEGCYISTGETTKGLVTHTLESWQFLGDVNEEGEVDMMKGVIKTTLSTFGVPAGNTGMSEDNNLYVKLLLVDNETTLQMNFPIGDQLKAINEYDGTQLDKNGRPIWPEVHVYWPEPLPEVEAVGGGSGGAFDVGVSDWGEEIVTVLPLI
ncbi:MAG: DUF5119 domain-containing protein [Bacteroidales bacterium]|nr:DUF5119 domain-containing protein [Bacteroidales bacterium]